VSPGRLVGLLRPYDSVTMLQGRDRARAARVLCVFLEAPLDDSTVSLRWRRLAAAVIGLGATTAVVVLDVAPTEQATLAFQLGVPVVSLGTVRRGRWWGVSAALSRPWRSWPPARTDAAFARAALAAHLGDDQPDLIWCAGAEAFLAVPKRLRKRAIVDYVDLPSRNRRELARVAVHRIKRRITHDGGVDASVFELVRDVQGGVGSRQLERFVGRRAAAVTVASPSEVRPGGRCVRTGVDDPGIVAPPAVEIPVPHFVFPGSFLYPPHQDAAEWFALFVLPPLRKLLPACRIVFAGECPEWMWEFGKLHDIEITGAIADIGQVLDSRSVVIAPIRSGSGTIVEVIDAWARGVPVVASSRAIEGLQATDGEDVLVADDPAEFAARCSMAARYPELRAKLAGNGRARYESEFTWPGIRAEMVSWLLSLPVRS
jgi:glycosyltransferase involved in cell wall biosynthesis